MKKAIWNHLPAKPEDVDRVRRALDSGTVRISQLPKLIGLSKTRTLCAVDDLIGNGHVREVERGLLMLEHKIKRQEDAGGDSVG